MIIKLLNKAPVDGTFRKPGEIVEVEDAIAAQWIKTGIAESVADDDVLVLSPDEDEVIIDDDDINDD